MKNKLKGTNFQIKVWKEILKIPKGKTKSYKEIAIAIGNLNHQGQWQMLVVKIHILLKYHVIV